MQNRLITLLACLICSIGLWAVSDDELKRMEADMLKYISSNNRDSFYNISEQLKDACKEAGDERLFYSAWSNQAVYEANCHQKALVGVDKTAQVLQRLLSGAKVNVIPSGCCGMAGSFGYEKEHYKTSLAIGEMVLFPAVRKVVKASDGFLTFVAAPGTSCRQQILDGTGVKAVHPIELLLRFMKKR